MKEDYYAYIYFNLEDLYKIKPEERLAIVENMYAVYKNMVIGQVLESVKKYGDEIQQNKS